jgi:hypothetical protein
LYSALDFCEEVAMMSIFMYRVSYLCLTVPIFKKAPAAVEAKVDAAAEKAKEAEEKAAKEKEQKAKEAEDKVSVLKARWEKHFAYCN